ncbi:MAG: ECF transporter S component [Oscillospiraceae bacterium]|nr:ECF transporter S component [Oscillospiraceae bacterium]
MRDTLKNLTLAAMFLALCLVLPFLTGQIPEIGSMLLPMHIPVLLCGLICGWKYGLAVGAVAPIMRSVILGMPPMFPSAITMAFELAAYGFVIGLLFKTAKWQCIKSLYRCMIVAMLAGRAVWGVVSAILLGIWGEGFTFAAFLAGAFLNAVPGIVLQLLLIPAIMLLLHKTHLVPFKNHKAVKACCN